MPVKKKTTKRVKKQVSNDVQGRDMSLDQYYEEIDVPCIRYLQGKELCFCDNCLYNEEKIPLTDKITWVLTVVNVAILISLVIKNV